MRRMQTEYQRAGRPQVRHGAGRCVIGRRTRSGRNPTGCWGFGRGRRWPKRRAALLPLSSSGSPIRPSSPYFPRPLGVDEEAEAFLEAEGGGLGGLELLLAGVDHGAELHGVQLVEGLFDQYRSSSAVAA